jgi:RNA polymerase sigma-70 factor (ECF subfamily)
MTRSEAIGTHDKQPGGPAALTLDFEAFYAEERARLFGVMCLVTGDRAEAEELAQEAFVRIWERWPQVAVMESPGGYLTRTAMNEFRKRARRAAMAKKLLPSLARGRHSHGPEGAILLDEALQVLEPRQRAALVLTELLGYSAEEAGRALGVKPSTIGALKYQGRARLKEVEVDD